MSFDAWRAKLEAFSWWDTYTSWANTAFESAWFIKSEDADGSFLVETKYDTYEVSPPLSYSVNDSYYETRWWTEAGQPVELDQMGKWQNLYGLKGLHLPEANSTLPQELWVLLQGGWSTKVRTPEQPERWRRKRSRSNEPEPRDFRQYLANSVGLTELDLYHFSCVLDSYNLGFTITPLKGVVETYEMSDLHVSISEPEVVVNAHAKAENLRNVGVGMTSYSFSISGTGGSSPLDDGWFGDTISAINRHLNSPGELLEAFSLATRFSTEKKWTEGFVKDSIDNIRTYLDSKDAESHFGMLQDAGFSVALIPMGGRSFIRP